MIFPRTFWFGLLELWRFPLLRGLDSILREESELITEKLAMMVLHFRGHWMRDVRVWAVYQEAVSVCGAREAESSVEGVRHLIQTAR